MPIIIEKGVDREITVLKSSENTLSLYPFGDKRMTRYTRSILIFTFLLLVTASQLPALGSAAEGWAIVQVTKLESSGLIYKSYEGNLRIVTFKEEPLNCSPTNDTHCYDPGVTEIHFSIDEDNKEPAHFINHNLGKQMVIRYRIHRITPVALSTDFEILEAQGQWNDLPRDMPRSFSIGKSGSKRNYALHGKVLRLEYRGLAMSTYEGLYYDSQRDTVHPFSLTDESMVKYIWNTMKVNKQFFFGISEARVTVARETPYDIFEINYDTRPESI